MSSSWNVTGMSANGKSSILLASDWLMLLAGVMVWNTILLTLGMGTDVNMSSGGTFCNQTYTSVDHRISKQY